MIASELWVLSMGSDYAENQVESVLLLLSELKASGLWKSWNIVLNERKKTTVEPFFRNWIECLSVPRWNICFQFSTLFELELLTRERLSVIFFWFFCSNLSLSSSRRFCLTRLDMKQFFFSIKPKLHFLEFWRLNRFPD